MIVENPDNNTGEAFLIYVRRISRQNTIYIYASTTLQIAMFAGYLLTHSLAFPILVVPITVIVFYSFSRMGYSIYLHLAGGTMSFSDFLKIRHRLAILPPILSVGFYLFIYPEFSSALWFRILLAAGFNFLIALRIYLSFHRENLMMADRWKRSARNLEIERLIEANLPKFRVGVPVVLVYSGSRVGSANASSVGIWRPIIMVADTLISALDQGELLGILSHELGHAVHRDSMKSFVSTTLALLILGDVSLYAWLKNILPTALIVICLLFSLVIYYRLILIHIMRRFEIRADRFAAAECGQGANLVKGLLRLREINRVPRKMPKNIVTAHPDLDFRLREIWKYSPKE